jgi:hypothetical protein
MKTRYLTFTAFALALAMIIISNMALAPKTNEITKETAILDGIGEKAMSLIPKHAICWDDAVEMKTYLDSIGIENSIVTCNVNICQNTEPGGVFYSIEHKEMGYLHNGRWFSENDCLRAHVVNSFVYRGETLYIDSTRSSEPARNSSVVLACFRY